MCLVYHMMNNQPSYRVRNSGFCRHTDSLAPHLSSAAIVSQRASSTHRTERKGWGVGGVAGVPGLPGTFVYRANRGEKETKEDK